MSLPPPTSGQIVNVRPLNDKLQAAESLALLRSPNMEIMRLVLAAGRAKPEHAVSGEITLQCIEGEVDLTTAGTTRLLAAGDLAWVAAGETYSIKAVTDASVLMTIQQPALTLL